MSKKLTEIEKKKNANVRALVAKAKKAAKSEPEAPVAAPVEKSESAVYIGKDPLTGKKLYK